MKDQNSIQRLNDNTLLDEVKALVRREKEIIVEVIEYLKEIEVRKLHLARGYSSMFTFSVEFLGYSEAEAHIRIQAARLTQVLPEVSEKIQSGELSLSVAAATQSHFRKENIRRKEQGQPFLNVKEKREALELVTGSSRREAEQNLNIHFAQTSAKTLSFVVSPEVEEKINKLMDLMAHKNFDRDLGKMVELLVDAELERYERKHGTVQIKLQAEVPNQDLPKDGYLVKAQSGESLFQQSESAVETKTTPKKPSGWRSQARHRNRYIPRNAKTLVWTKYKGQCTYQDPLTGKKCCSKHGIQIDHKLALAKGGRHQAENLTLLCAGHNSWKSDRLIE